MSFFFGRGVLRPIASKIKPFNICRNLSQKVFNMQLPTIPSKRISSAGLLLQEKLRATSLKIENELGYSEEERDDSFRLVRHNHVPATYTNKYLTSFPYYFFCVDKSCFR